ncbi:MAG: cellulose binding domain-containing protein [Candidatus Thiodiazotropha sp.]
MKKKDTWIVNVGTTRMQASFSVMQVTLTFFLLLGMTLSALATASDLGLSEEDCRCCHGASLADRHHLMVIDRGLECLNCHPMTWNPTTVQYDVTVTRDCPQCHTGSLADRHHLLVDQVTYNCFSCHTIAWDPVTLMYVAQFNANCDSSSQHPPVHSATINGTVKNSSGSGVAWARIKTDDPEYSTLTTDTGSFQLAEIPPGEYLLTASADGYISSSQHINVAENQTLSVNLVLLPLTVSPTITGLVMDRTRTPIQGVRIYSDDEHFFARSDADGAFTLVDLAVGEITLTAERDGYGSRTQNLSIAAGQNMTVEFILPDLPMEACNDQIDNDKNGYADCDDSSCAGTAACQTPLEICGDGLDNDANGLADCSDLACRETAGCQQPSTEICDDQVDNDNNSLTDCADPACSTRIHCLTEICNDGIDNNGDAIIDCADPVCVSTSKCLSPPVEICDDGIDNDADGHIDCADGKCNSTPACLPPGNDETSSDNACEYIVQDEWANGFTAVIRIHNRGTTPINGWSVNWAYADDTIIRAVWNASLSGANPYTADSLNWNAVIYPGRSVDIGISGDKSPPPTAQIPTLTGPECNANGNLICDYIVQGEWNEGFNAAIRLHNRGSVPVQGWEVEWAYTDGSTVNHFWSANLSGSNPYKASNLDWNTIINPDSSVYFGVIGTKREVQAEVPVVTGDVCGTVR